MMMNNNNQMSLKNRKHQEVFKAVLNNFACYFHLNKIKQINQSTFTERNGGNYHVLRLKEILYYQLNKMVKELHVLYGIQDVSTMKSLAEKVKQMHMKSFPDIQFDENEANGIFMSTFKELQVTVSTTQYEQQRPVDHVDLTKQLSPYGQNEIWHNNQQNLNHSTFSNQNSNYSSTQMPQHQQQLVVQRQTMQAYQQQPIPQYQQQNSATNQQIRDYQNNSVDRNTILSTMLQQPMRQIPQAQQHPSLTLLERMEYNQMTQEKHLKVSQQMPQQTEQQTAQQINNISALPQISSFSRVNNHNAASQNTSFVTTNDMSYCPPTQNNTHATANANYGSPVAPKPQYTSYQALPPNKSQYQSQNIMRPFNVNNQHVPNAFVQPAQSNYVMNQLSPSSIQNRNSPNNSTILNQRPQQITPAQHSLQSNQINRSNHNLPSMNLPLQQQMQKECRQSPMTNLSKIQTQQAIPQQQLQTPQQTFVSNLQNNIYHIPILPIQEDTSDTNSSTHEAQTNCQYIFANNVLVCPPICRDMPTLDCSEICVQNSEIEKIPQEKRKSVDEKQGQPESKRSKNVPSIDESKSTETESEKREENSEVLPSIDKEKDELIERLLFGSLQNDRVTAKNVNSQELGKEKVTQNEHQKEHEKEHQEEVEEVTKERIENRIKKKVESSQLENTENAPANMEQTIDNNSSISKENEPKSIGNCANETVTEVISREKRSIDQSAKVNAQKWVENENIAEIDATHELGKNNDNKGNTEKNQKDQNEKEVNNSSENSKQLNTEPNNTKTVGDEDRKNKSHCTTPLLDEAYEEYEISDSDSDCVILVESVTSTSFKWNADEKKQKIKKEIKTIVGAAQNEQVITCVELSDDNSSDALVIDENVKSENIEDKKDIKLKNFFCNQCSMPAISKCRACHCAAYCSKLCQQKNVSIHSNHCTNFDIRPI